MPLPKPSTGEERGTFVKRCMANAETNNDFPDDAQRFAVCNDIYSSSKFSDSIKEVKDAIANKSRNSH